MRCVPLLRTRERGKLSVHAQVVIRALSENPALIDFGLVPRALLGLLALLCGNGYIVGINQARPTRLKRHRAAAR